MAGSAKMVPRQPSRLRQLSSSLSQTTCTLVSRVVKPDGDEPTTFLKVNYAFAVTLSMSAIFHLYSKFKLLYEIIV